MAHLAMMANDSPSTSLLAGSSWHHRRSVLYGAIVILTVPKHISSGGFWWHFPWDSIIWPWDSIIWPWDSIIWPWDSIIWPWDSIIWPWDSIIWPKGIIFHQPRLPWNSRGSPFLSYLVGENRSSNLTRIMRCCNLTRIMRCWYLRWERRM